MTSRLLIPLAAAATLLPSLGFAQEAEYATAADTAFIFNTILFLIGGFLVFWMAAGFAMLEAGLVRSKNVTTQLTKNIALFALAAILYWLVGYNIMYPGDAWIIPGVFGTFATKDIKTAIDAGGYSNASDFFFQLMFCATTASIVSGTLAERIKLWPFLIFTIVLTRSKQAGSGAQAGCLRRASATSRAPLWSTPRAALRLWQVRWCLAPVSANTKTVV
jgi:Amt family ammonium transporter